MKSSRPVVPSSGFTRMHDAPPKDYCQRIRKRLMDQAPDFPAPPTLTKIGLAVL